MSPARAQNDAGSLFEVNCAGRRRSHASGNTAVGKAAKIPDMHSANVQKITDTELTEMTMDGKRSRRGLSYAMPSNKKQAYRRSDQAGARRPFAGSGINRASFAAVADDVSDSSQDSVSDVFSRCPREDWIGIRVPY
jgi:hypothetical protein